MQEHIPTPTPPLPASRLYSLIGSADREVIRQEEGGRGGWGANFLQECDPTRMSLQDHKILAGLMSVRACVCVCVSHLVQKGT